MTNGTEIPKGLCLNCSSELLGEFCHVCGQATAVHRYRFSTVAADAYRELRKIDLTTAFSTAWELLIRPGTFVRSYLAGRRVGYINPIKFFFYAFVADTAVRSLLLFLTGDKTFSNLLFSDGWFQATDLIATVFLGLLWRVFYRKSELNAAECAVAALLYQAESNFLSTVLLILTLPLQLLGKSYHPMSRIVETIIAISYSYFFAYQLFTGSKFAILIKQTILVVLFLIVMLVALMIQMTIRGQLIPAVSK